jgi:drug/metabolite transporter (DMT)-like permease
MTRLPDTPATGVLIMTVAMVIAPVMDIFAKLLTETLSPGHAALGRFLAQSLFLIPFVSLTGQWGRPTRLHAVAGVCLAIAIWCIIAAVQVMPVANALAIFFVEPLILTLLSAWILGERIGWRRMTAVAVGLLGVLIVLRPNVAAFGWSAALPLGTAFFFALYLLTTRVMTQRGSLLALQFWTGSFALLALGAVTLATLPLGLEGLELRPMGGREVALIAAMGVIACISHQLIAQAFRRAEAGALAPLQYLEIFSAVVLGWLVFGDFPDTLTWVGTAIIVASGIYVFQRERALAAADAAGGPAP